MEKILDYINNYINFYLENLDELTQKNEEKYRKIQKNKEKMEEIAKKIEKLSLQSMEDINYEIQKLLNE